MRGIIQTTKKRSVSYTHLRAHETVLDLVCRLLLEKKKYSHLHHLSPYCLYYIVFSPSRHPSTCVRAHRPVYLVDPFC
ncbi:hypothetical protein PVA38_06865 [Streptococcus pneumoniae D39]|nr:hypothetical protein PVA38_06865 [Streptococcus pneumoniae D39]